MVNISVMYNHFLIPPSSIRVTEKIIASRAQKMRNNTK